MSEPKTFKQIWLALAIGEDGQEGVVTLSIDRDGEVSHKSMFVTGEEWLPGLLDDARKISRQQNLSVRVVRFDASDEVHVFRTGH